MSAVIIACPDPDLKELISQVLDENRNSLFNVAESNEILDLLKSGKCDIVIAQNDFEGMNGAELFKLIFKESPGTALLLFADSYESVNIAKPFVYSNLDIILDKKSKDEIFYRVHRLLNRKHSAGNSLVLEHTKKISRAAHQINNPLTAIIGNAEIMLMNDNLSIDDRESLDSIVSSGEKIASTIERLKKEFSQAVEEMKGRQRDTSLLDFEGTGEQGRNSILIIDDERYITETLAKFLKSLNYNADSANSGEEALDILDTQHYDAIILDMLMPDLDGYDTLVKIKEMYNGKDEEMPQVIIYTGFVDEQRVQDCLGIGAYKVMQKPARATSLAEVIKDALNQAEND